MDRRALHEGLVRLAEGGADAASGALSALMAPDAVWRGSHPLNEMAGAEAVADRVWRPLLTAMPDLERRDAIFVGGAFEGREMIAAMGHYCGTFAADWLGIPATRGAVWLRYGEVHELDGDGRIVRSTCLWDLLDLMRQAGVWPVAPSLGAEEAWPGPLTGDGIRFAPSDPGQGAASLAQTLAMHGTLGAYRDLDAGREGLLGMPQRDHWHPRMMWYGPAGIGTARGLSGFVDVHQLPFRRAFPNRKGGGQWDDIPEKRATLGGGHFVRIGDGPYSVTGGWPSVFAVHSGGGFMGLPPTGREVGMRVMDFYLHHEGSIRENWVPIDVIDLLRQMGFDVFARLAEMRGQPPA